MSSTCEYIKAFKEYQKHGYTVVIKASEGGYYEVRELIGHQYMEISTSCTWLEALKSYKAILKTL